LDDFLRGLEKLNLEDDPVDETVEAGLIWGFFAMSASPSFFLRLSFILLLVLLRAMMRSDQRLYFYYRVL